MKVLEEGAMALVEANSGRPLKGVGCRVRFKIDVWKRRLSVDRGFHHIIPLELV